MKQIPVGRSFQIFALSVILLFALGCFLHQRAQAATVDDSGDVGRFSSMAVESEDAGTAHISYYDFTNGSLKYASSGSGTWQVEPVDEIGTVGLYTSIAVGNLSDVHISYYDETNQVLKYATKASGQWSLATVDDTGSVGRHTSIAADGLGDVHISYYDETNHTLKYATKATGGEWEVETVDEMDSIGLYSSIAVDSAGGVHISYYDQANGDLKYATSGSSWTIETFDETGDVGRFTSLVVEDSGTAHISYYDDSNQAVKYATNASGFWVMEDVDSVPNVGEATSLCLSASGVAHICYGSFDGDTDEWLLKHASNPSGRWQTEALVDGDLGSGWCSVALDASGIAHVSYYAFDLENAQGALDYLSLASVPAGNGEDYLTLSCAHTLTHVESVANPSPTNTPSQVDFPYGFFGFSVTNVGVGGHTEVTFTLRDNGETLPNTYYKHDAAGWYEFLYDDETQTGAEIDGNVVILHFVDGGRGDDSSQEGEIVDPGGPGVETTEPGGGGGGCFISAFSCDSLATSCMRLVKMFSGRLGCWRTR